MALFRRPLLACAGCLLFLSPTAAFAEEPVETALKAFVASIDASPDWAATYGSVTYDAATAAGTLSGLRIKSETTPTEFDFETLTVAGYAASADGGFTARELKADGGTVNAGFVAMSLDGIDITDLTVPRLAFPSYDPAKPFTSMIRTYGEALKASLGGARIGSIILNEKLNGLNNRIVYRDFVMGAMKDGKVASVKIGPLSLETPSPEGLVAMNVAAIEASGMDLAAMVHVSDPDQYAGGVGDMVWHTVLDKASYSNVSMELPGVKMTIAGLAMDGFRMRQPKDGFAALYDALITNPQMTESDQQELIRRQFPNLIALMGIGRFAVSGISVVASGIDRLQLGDFHMNDLSSDGLGEMGIAGLDGLVQGQGSIKVGHFAIGGITFPPLDAIRAAMSPSERGQVDPRTLMPKLGFLDAGGLELISADLPRSALDSVRVDLGKYVGVVPTSVSVDVKGLDVPVQLMERSQQQIFARFGLDHILAAYRLKLAWDEATQILDISDFYAGIAKLGSIGGSAELGGLTRPELLASGRLVDAAPDMSLVKAQITLTDDSVIDSALALLAERMKFPKDKIRQQFADALPFLLSVTVLTDPTMMKIFRQSGLLGKVTPAIKTFMAVPRSSITATFAPAKPIPLASIAPAVQNTPETVLDTLGFSLSADGKAAAPAPDQLRPSQPAN